MEFDSLGTLDLSKGPTSSRIQIVGGNISIQPLVRNFCGAPTYTLEVSNDDGEQDLSKKTKLDEDFSGTYYPFDPLSTDLDVNSKAIQINMESIPWKYLRIKICSAPGDSGEVEFLISQF